MIALNSNTSTWDREAGISKVQDQPQLNGELEAILDYFKPCLKNNKK